ncbi:MAG: MFS transporter [Methylophilaceae bacterium]|nr:MFS transporter [Methylophilaceae bacterium]MBL6726425.1 MFS transporter [Methylophilaceae bacterium]MBL6728953.1 MFS transporter [Methylophilaceae bacterium]MBL6790931.1 MFS transporter [Methylophilaceae bacterium]
MTKSLYWKLSKFYYLYYAFVGLFTPYWGLYLTSLKFSPIQIGLLLALFQFGRVVSPNIWGWLADRTNKRSQWVRLIAMMGSIFFVYSFFANSFYEILFIMMSMSIFTSSTIPLIESLTLAHLSSGKGNFDYSKIRVWGSVGFICAALFMGFGIDFFGIKALLFVLLSVQILIYFQSLRVPEHVSDIKNEARRPILNVIKDPQVIAVILGCTLMVSSHGLLYNFYSIYLNTLDYSSMVIGALWAVGVICEILIFLCMPKILKLVDLKQVLLISLILAVARFFLIGTFADNLWVLIFAQTLHAATFGSFHVASVQIIECFFHTEHHARGQSLYNSITYGVGGVVGGVVGGALIELIGMSETFRLSALLPLLGIIVFYFGLKNFPKKV